MVKTTKCCLKGWHLAATKWSFGLQNHGYFNSGLLASLIAFGCRLQGCARQWRQRKAACILLMMVALDCSANELPTLTIVTGLNQSSMSDRIEQQLKAAYLQLGYQMRVQRLPAGRSLMMTNAGEFDGELFRIAEVAEKYPNLLQVPAPLERINLHAFVKRNAKSNYSFWQQNQKLRVAYIRGFKMAESYMFSGEPVPMNTVAQAVQMLLQDKVDVLLEDPASVFSATLELSPDGQLEQLPEVLATADLYHFIHKKHQQLLIPLAALLSATR